MQTNATHDKIIRTKPLKTGYGGPNGKANGNGAKHGWKRLNKRFKEVE